MLTLRAPFSRLFAFGYLRFATVHFVRLATLPPSGSLRLSICLRRSSTRCALVPRRCREPSPPGAFEPASCQGFDCMVAAETTWFSGHVMILPRITNFHFGSDSFCRWVMHGAYRTSRRRSGWQGAERVSQQGALGRRILGTRTAHPYQPCVARHLRAGSGRPDGIAPVRAPTPPDVRFSASGGW